MRRTALIALLLTGSRVAGASPARALDLTPVPTANPKTPGVVAPNVLSPEPAEVVRGRPGSNVEAPGPAPARGHRPALRLRCVLPLPGTRIRPEAFLNQQGSITRISLDADVAHRVTLLATAHVNEAPPPTFDGIDLVSVGNPGSSSRTREAAPAP